MRPTPPLPALSRDCALFLDVDGTLLDFSVRPDGVIVPLGLPAMLHSLGGWLDGALALLSGRRVTDIEALFGPGLAVGAEHGALLRAADGTLIAEASPNPALAALAAPLRAAIAARPGTLLEEKRFGLVLHWRAAPAMAQELAALGAALAAAHPGLMLQPAHEALEIRLRGTDKGAALETFMGMPPFAGRRPVFIGDDATDEPAIARAKEMGGLGLHVARDFGGRTEAVRAWLAQSLEKGDIS
ncbi:MAG TPA: trehalose-phosphatase [Acidocella sp.]|nr:trehalose-phosphatase [Acidocella sp.]